MISGGRKPEFFRDSTRSNQNRSNISQMNQISQPEKSHIGESRRLKVQFIQNNPNQSQNVNIQINPKTWPNLKVNDLVEISSLSNQNNALANSNQLNTSLSRGAASSLIQSSSSTNSTSINPNQQNSNDDDTSPFLVQILQSSFSESIPLDSIRIDLAASQPPFSIRNFSYVNAVIVDRSNVMLDLVEVIFKEQYVNGYDMLRIKKCVENSCVYLKKTVEFCLIRCSVRDLWSVNGDNVTCGYVGEKTRLVFRSQSAMCLIYIQMSREMWEFDVNGEMYHEKAINFLGELFTNWKNQLCTHDVTIALFSRIFYDAKSIDEFPSSICGDIKKDHKNRFYEDFFRVVYQNERYEDWTPTLIILKRLIKEYRDYILNYHSRQLKCHMPSGCLSSAAEGNFLETLNLSSSVFERHFIDRPFDRTGMMSLVITPGNGIYEVNRDLAKITKERVIDNGIGSDLVCLGEQPLHAVPLFKYDTIDAFDIPNWINMSFYESSEMIRFCNSCFLPRSKIKLKAKSNKFNSEGILPDYSSDKSLTSLEESDNIFEMIPKDNPTDAFIPYKKTSKSQNINHQNFRNKSRRIYNTSTSNLSSSMVSAHEFPNIKDDNDDADDDSSVDFDSDYEGAPGEDAKKTKRKINPFMPNQVKRSQRRPWAHIFPLRSDGSPIFPHEETANIDAKLTNDQPSVSVTQNVSITDPSQMPKISPDSGYINSTVKITNLFNRTQTISESSSLLMLSTTNGLKKRLPINKSIKSTWETTNNDESIGLLKTGVAWKSLTIPACFPLTTDYTPSEKIIREKFQCASDYTLLLETIREEYGYLNYEYNDKITMSQVFIELVGHRLSMGFQIVVPKNIYTHNSNSGSNSESISTTPTNSNQSHLSDIKTHTLTNTLHSNFICDLSQSGSILPRNNLKSIKGYYKLSLGRIFHELFYIVDPSDNSEQVKVEIYVPKTKNKSQPGKSIEYKYRFQVPDSKTYDISYCDMTRANIESVKWNYIDRYISIQGNGSLTPSELEKCWRQRLYLLPVMYVSNKSVNLEPANQVAYNLNSLGFTNLTQSQIPASMIQNPYSTLKCDIFQRKTEEELQFFRDYYFLKFMEGLNKLNRADERRLYSRSTIHYLEFLSSQPGHVTPNTNTNSDSVLAISAITSALTQINNSNSLNQTNPNKNQLISFPSINKKNFSTAPVKLPSPKTHLLPLVSRYMETSDQNLKIEIVNYLKNEYTSHMLSPTYGIPCIQNKNDIPLHCFITAEAVWWCIEYINDCITESDGIKLMQIMSDFDIIRHISNQKILFVHGFYLFYFLTEETLNHRLYTKDYCEVGFVDIESPREQSDRFKLVSSKHLLPEYTSTLPISSRNLFESYINLFKNYSNTNFTNTSPEGILKLVNVDVDPSRKSNRVEWASAVYRSYYHQLCAFELEVQWEVATCSLLSETVNSWSKLSNRFNYHIVPAPIDPFAMPLLQNSDPLRGPIYIGLNLKCMLNNETALFQEILDERYKDCLEELFSDKYNSTFKLESSSSSSSESFNSSACSSLTTTTATNNLATRAEKMLEYLTDKSPEFLAFLNKKYENKKNLDRRLKEDAEFIRQEFFDFVEYERIIRLIYFQEAILEKFGFIRNAAVVKNLFSDEDATFFIHASGGMFVYIPNYYNNYSNRSRHPSANNNIHNFTDPSKSSALILTKTNEFLENNRERLLTRNSEIGEDLTDGKAISKNISVNSSSKTSFNASLNNSYVSNSHLNNVQNHQNRERSSTKSQYFQFLKINGNNYLPDVINSVEKENKSESNEELSTDLKRDSPVLDFIEVKNDLLFKPKSSNPKISAKNEKIDQIQHQHQKEQMLLQRFANATTNSSYQKYLSQNRKIPFYADTEQFIGFFWSWNFMLGKRWRSQYTGDEQFQDNMLSDFRLFCTNQDGRLEKFFRESKDLLK
ncbi:unnamed protein product [Brachionus calyciflorus]|uniref:DEP domain-containing protein 5 n=1 Tax=Brachionus calyciflorus TaxID=104777 RepID=A0A813TA30_9BILA|nr:unnamed protein product [Brachionus calyciflorus]